MERESGVHLGEGERFTEADGRGDSEKGGVTSLPPKTKLSASPHLHDSPYYSPEQWRPLFLDFLKHLKVQTKDYGEITLSERLFGAQELFLESIVEGLEDGIRHFVNLKARQLGISTVSLALDLFWLAFHPGTQGALITDTAGNLAKFRVIIDQLLTGLPKHLKIRYDTSNRDMLVLSNGSVLDYLVAGIRQKGRGKAVTLGTSRAYNFVHATECSNWGDESSYDSLMASLSEHHPDRLYIFESTARGFNLFHTIWKGAENDAETQRAVFIGWWAKESYAVGVDSDLFRKYWDGLLSDEEKERADIVEARYGVFIKPEQWAWYRWKKETRQSAEGSMESNYPFHAEEAFVATGKGFFPVKQVSNDLRCIIEGTTVAPFNGYKYQLGDEFIDTKVLPVLSISEADLRIWEEPNEHGRYVFGVDPAYGRDEENDRSVISVWRCYADRVIQVAEYATAIPETHHLAWVMCHLAGNYKHCLINLELTGPGYAVMKEMDTLKILMKNGYMDRNFVPQQGMRDFFGKAKWYLYHRPDSMGAGYVMNWKMGSENKQTIFNQYRDLYITKQMEIKSKPLLEEMQTIVQDGVEICASGSNKDDRPVACALAMKAWIDFVRQPLINERKTFSNVLQAEADAKKPYQGFVRSIYDDWMKKQSEFRTRRDIEREWAQDGEDYEDAGIGDVGYDVSDDPEEIYG